MQKTTLGKIAIEYHPQQALATGLGSLIDLALTQTGSAGAYIYRAVAGETTVLDLVWCAGSAPAGFGNFHVLVAGAKAVWHAGFNTMVSLPARASWDWRFEDFPEFLLNRFEAVTAIPLLDRGIAVGRAHFCRSEAKAFGPAETSFLSQLSEPMGALLAATSARAELQSELDRVSRKLAERKAVERAKGLLQQRFSWTEEESYIYLRQNSRNRRVTLAEIAHEIIATAARVEGSEDVAA